MGSTLDSAQSQQSAAPGEPSKTELKAETESKPEPVTPLSAILESLQPEDRGKDERILFQRDSAASRRQDSSTESNQSAQQHPQTISRLRQARMEAEAQGRPVSFRRRGATDDASTPPDSLSALGQNYLNDLPMTPSDKRSAAARKVSETAAVQAQAQAQAQAAQHRQKQAQETAQITWSRQRGFGKTMDRTNQNDAEALTREERHVHNELSKVMPKEAQLFGVHLAEDTSTIHAQAVVKDQTQAHRLYLARRTFEAETGRVLDLQLLRSKPASKSTQSSSATDAPPQAKALPREGDTPARPKSEPRQISEERDVATAATSANPLAKRLATASDPISEILAAQVIATFPPNQQPSQALASVRRHEFGVPLGRVSKLDHRIQVEGQQGGSRGGGRRSARRSRREEEDDGKAIFSKERNDARPYEAQRELSELVRQQSEEQGQEHQRQQQHDEGSRQRAQTSNCPSCGTSLPEGQVGSCPVCAQSGPDVMALAKIHYRAAGIKFLATVDAFTATEEARSLILAGATPSVVSLRYEQELVGHKDLLKFKVRA